MRRNGTSLAQKFERADIESCSNTFDDGQRRITPTTLDLANITVRKMNVVSQDFEGDPFGFADPSYVSTKCSSQFHRCKRTDRAKFDQSL